MTWLNKTSQNKKRRPLFSKNVLKIVPIHVHKFSFFNTSHTYRVFGNYFRPRWKPLATLVWETRGDCCLKSLKEEQIILYSQHLPKKNFSLIASRKEKKYMKFVKMTFSCGNYNIFSCCLPETRTKDHRKRSPVFELQAKYLCLELKTSGLSTGKFLCLYNLFSYPFFYSNSLQNPKIGMCN